MDDLETVRERLRYFADGSPFLPPRTDALYEALIYLVDVVEDLFRRSCQHDRTN